MHNLYLNRVFIEETYLKVITAIYNKPAANITLSAEKLPLKSGARQGCSLFPFLFNIILEVLATETKQEKSFVCCSHTLSSPRRG